MPRVCESECALLQVFQDPTLYFTYRRIRLAGETRLPARRPRALSALSSQAQASMLPVVARQHLIAQVDQERAAAVAAGNTTVVKASVTSLEVVSRQPRRIELTAEVAYSDRTTDRSGSVVDRTEPGSLRITYILGRDGDQWRLTAYIPQG